MPISKSLNMRSLFSSSSRSSVTRTDSTRAASAKQVDNTDPQTSSSTTLPVPSESDRNISARKSSKERVLTFLRWGKNNRSTSKKKTVLMDGKWHVQSPLATKNGNATLAAKLFEESVLDSIQMGTSDNRSWATRTEDMNNALAKLNMLGPDQFNPLSAEGRVALRDIFRNMLNDIRTQQSRIGEIFREKEAASVSSDIQEDDILNEIKNAKEVLDAVGEKVDKLIDMTITPIGVRLREQARHMRELDSSHEETEKSNEKAFLEYFKFKKIEEIESRQFLKPSVEKMRTKSKADVALKAISKEFSREMEQSQSGPSTERKKMIMQSEIKRLENSEKEDNNNWGMTLYEQNAKRIEVSNQITDLLSEAAKAGIDLSNELSTDEIVYLTRAMGMDTNKRLDERGLVGGDRKDIQYVGEKFTRKTIEVTKRETDKLARQNADLLHEPQLQRLLTRLNEQETLLDQLIAHPLQPGSTEVVSTSAENIHGVLKRIDKSEVSRLCNHNEVKGQRAKSRISEQLDRIGAGVTNLRKAISDTLDVPETSTNNLSDEDRLRLTQAAKSLEHAQSELDSLQGNIPSNIKAAAPSDKGAHHAAWFRWLRRLPKTPA